MNRHDDELLRVELEALERAAPTAEPPGFRRGPAWLRPPALAGAVAAGLLAAVGVSAWLLWARPPEVGSASPSPTVSASPTAEPTPEPTTSPLPSPTIEPTPTSTPEPTAAPRAGWSYATLDVGDGQVLSVVEARGLLFALGDAGANAGIWVSEDGQRQSWTQAQVPAPPDGTTFNAFDLVDAGDRLVVVAPGGDAAGSGYFLTAIYVSEDGQRWRTADTPAMDGAAQFALARAGDRLFAIGTEIWRSDDAGETWTVALPRAEFGGKSLDVASRGDLIVAVGQAGGGDLAEPPMYAWISSDAGSTWRRVVVDADSVGSTVAIGTDGTIVATSGIGATWVSHDAGQSWSEGASRCCGGAIVSTPSGFVLLPDRAGADVSVSTDGVAWQSAGIIDLGVHRATYGPRFGLVAAGDDAVAMGPHPFP